MQQQHFIDPLPDEIWDFILNGADIHATRILDPMWRPWAALVCRRWYHLVRASKQRPPIPTPPFAKTWRSNKAAWTTGCVLYASSVADLLCDTALRNTVDPPQLDDTIAETVRVALAARGACVVMVSLALEASGVPAALTYARARLDAPCVIAIQDMAVERHDITLKNPLIAWAKDKRGYLSSPLEHIREGARAPATASDRALDALRALVSVRRQHPDALDRYDRQAILFVLDRYAYEIALMGDFKLLDRLFALGGSTRSGGTSPETERLPGIWYDDGDGDEDNANNLTVGGDASDAGEARHGIHPHHLINGTRCRSERSRFARGTTVESYWVSKAVNGAILGGRADVLDFIVERAGWICVMWAPRHAIKSDCVALFEVADARGLTYDAVSILRDAIESGGPRVCEHMYDAAQRAGDRAELLSLLMSIRYPSSPRVWSWARDKGFTPDARWFDDIYMRYDVVSFGPWVIAADPAFKRRSMASLAFVWPREAMRHVGALVVASVSTEARNERHAVSGLLDALERAQCQIDLWRMAVDDIRAQANGGMLVALVFALHWAARLAHYCSPTRVPLPSRTNRIAAALCVGRASGWLRSSNAKPHSLAAWNRVCRLQTLGDDLVANVRDALSRPVQTLDERAHLCIGRAVLDHLVNALR